MEFVCGDVRKPEDLDRLPPISAMIECSAEPSVMGGVDGDTGYLVHTNLTGAYNCLELARRDGAFFVFLSTSRVYPVAPQVALSAGGGRRRDSRSSAEQDVPGVSPAGITEGFPLDGRAHSLRRDQARRRVTDRGVPRRLGRARGDRPLRGDRRAMADGQGRSGRVHALDARPPFQPAAQLHRLRWHGQAGPRSAALEDLSTCRTPAARSRAPGTGVRSTSAGGAIAASPAGNDRDLSPPDRQQVAIAGRRPGRGTCPYTF